MKSAIHIGISINEYYDMTPYELSVAINVFNDNQKLELEKHKLQLEENLFVAYHIALWQRVEKLSGQNLLDVLDKLNGKKENEKKQTPEEMFEEVKKLNAAFGGTTF